MSNPIVAKEEIDDYLNIRATKMTTKLQLILQRRVLRPAELPLQDWRILLSLARYGDCHLRLITRRTELDPAHASRAAAQLEQRGLISRRDDPDDKRRSLLSLTKEGKALFRNIWPSACALTEQEFEQFKTLMDRVTARADNILESQKQNLMQEEDADAS